MEDSTIGSSRARRGFQGLRDRSTRRVSMRGRQLSTRGSLVDGKASTSTTSYLLNLMSCSRWRKLIGYNRIQRGRSTSVDKPATQTVSPYCADGLGAALTVIKTLNLWDEASTGLATDSSSPKREPRWPVFIAAPFSMTSIAAT